MSWGWAGLFLLWGFSLGFWACYALGWFIDEWEKKQ